jgi:D-3-phosphoglycerate dehydrogenase / 2-oxoglutarate reductase
MFQILTLNKISEKGLNLFDADRYAYGSEIENPDGILVRSQKMHEMELPGSLKAIARAGAGVNNIPLDRCTERGVVVFNTPGANANGVKELVIAGMLLSSRKIYQGMQWVHSIKDQGDEIPALVEKEKSRFAGPEIAGKTLGVIGLGAIGVMVANAAEGMNMRVIGYDPFISVESAWGLSKSVERAKSVESLLSRVDYLSIHIPLNDETRGFINTARIARMRSGVRILNFSRGGLVNDPDLAEALKSGAVAAYVTDFPEKDILDAPNVYPIPHLGASTPESEENCAVMAVRQIKDFLETGNIKNSVNFPECVMDPNGGRRIIIANRNIPNMVGQITAIVAEKNLNIQDLLNKHHGDVAYNIIDIEGEIDEATLDRIRQIEGVIMARMVY